MAREVKSMPPAPASLPAGAERRHLVTAEVIKRAPAERPAHDTIEAIAAWLIGGARRVPSALQVFDEFAWRLLAAGLPLLRATLHSPTLHPQYLGTTFIWWRTTGQTEQILVEHGFVDEVPYQDNPVRRVSVGGEILRRRLDVPNDELDFAVLHELKAAGGTDYFALPMPSAHGRSYVHSYVTDGPSGFSEAEIGNLTMISQRVSIIADMYSQRTLTRNLINAYLGPKTGPLVLAGQIRRGMGQELTAVLWSSDLRGFTERSDRLGGGQMITILNALFDAQAKAIDEHGGEILKFVGDGLIAIFPINGAPGTATRNALAAACEAQASLRRPTGDAILACEPPLRIVVALHIGTAIYGNIGAAQRLDFTVIGPAVNLVSRVEAVAKHLDRPIVVTDDFARAYDGPLVSLGRHQLRGLTAPHELYAPAPGIGGDQA
jgi:adenylate cyclase